MGSVKLNKSNFSGKIQMDNLIGIISDTHDHMIHIEKAVMEFNRMNCSLVLHAGDFVAPFAAAEFEKLNCPLTGVFGNNDGELEGLIKKVGKIGAVSKPPALIEHSNRTIVIMHEPWYLDKYVSSNNIDIIVYGHTHKPEIRHGRPLVVNPGEACGWLSGRPTIAIVNLETMEAEIIDIL
jgi:putative phosphoesterase